MLKLYLMLVLLAAAVFAESVRETETWVPVKSKSPHEDLESSGDSSNGDFEFSDAKLAPDDEDAYKKYVANGYEEYNEEEYDDDDDDDYSDYDMSGSGYSDVITSLDEGEDKNDIPDLEPPFAPKPTIDERVLVEKNEVAVKAAPRDNHASHNVLMSHAGEDSMFNNKEVLAAVIAGGIVGLIFGVILIVVLVHFVLRIKKKDEGSYDLGKTPIYKKAPTTEIYA